MLHLVHLMGQVLEGSLRTFPPMVHCADLRLEHRLETEEVGCCDEIPDTATKV